MSHEQQEFKKKNKIDLTINKTGWNKDKQINRRKNGIFNGKKIGD